VAEGTRMPPQFVKFWVAGPGAARIAWNTPGDFERCIVEIQAEVTEGGHAPLSDRMIKGACATLHKLATGGPPGHGSAE
jgi:hypothetical protein